MLVRECAPLCLAADSGWGGVSRGWARTGAAPTMLRQSAGVKVSHCEGREATRSNPPAAHRGILDTFTARA